MRGEEQKYIEYAAKRTTCWVAYNPPSRSIIIPCTDALVCWTLIHVIKYDSFIFNITTRQRPITLLKY